MTRSTNKFSLLFFSVLQFAFSIGNENEKVAITIPNARKNLPEIFLCTGIQLKNDSDLYIVKFEPNATMDRIHHMVLYGCLTPGSKNPVWIKSGSFQYELQFHTEAEPRLGNENCGHGPIGIADDEYELSSVCSSKYTIMYAWARNASTLNLPPEVGFKVAGNTTVQYLVLQFHYVDTFNQVDDGSVSLSKLFLHFTRKPIKRLAGTFFLGSTGNIPPNSTETWDSACTIVENKTIHPFAFRIHTHHYGTMVSGYRVRPDRNGKHHWTLIGKKNPQKPHMFYPSSNITVTKGDTIAARCSYYNNKTVTVSSGFNDIDEMCNYYVMYYVEEGEPLRMRNCWTKGTPDYRWEMELNNIPADVSAPE